MKNFSIKKYPKSQILILNSSPFEITNFISKNQWLMLKMKISTVDADAGVNNLLITISSHVENNL